MAQQTLNDGVSFGEQRSKINSNFTELYSTKTTNSNAAITGGIINGTSIGQTTPAPGSFTTLSASGTIWTSSGLDLNNTVGGTWSNYAAADGSVRWYKNSDRLILTTSGLSVAGSGTFGGNVGAAGATPIAGAGGVQLGNTYAYGFQGPMGYIWSNTKYTDGYRRIIDGPSAEYAHSAGNHIWSSSAYGLAGEQISFTQVMTLDASGRLFINVPNSTGYGDGHRISRTISEGSFVIAIDGNSGEFTSAYQCVASGGFSTANAAEWVGKNSVTNRSINAGGTINASGADYAEYERNNGLSIIKGQVVGFKSDGTLTLTFSEAIRFAVKSTDPSYVGGDVWGSEAQVGKRPEQPIYTAPAYTCPQEPVEPTAPTVAGEDAVNDEADDSEYLESLNAYNEAQTTHAEAVASAEAAHAEAMTQYEADKAAFEERLEAARQTVDRIAYSGKVPCNVFGATPGGYIIAGQDEDGFIIGKFVQDPDFVQYKKAVGRVNRILDDGRCEIAVIIH